MGSVYNYASVNHDAFESRNFFNRRNAPTHHNWTKAAGNGAVLCGEKRSNGRSEDDRRQKNINKNTNSMKSLGKNFKKSLNKNKSTTATRTTTSRPVRATKRMGNGEKSHSFVFYWGGEGRSAQRVIFSIRDEL